MKKIAIVTGASSGFGEAIARHLSKLGFDLALGARRIDRLRTLQKEIQKNNEVWVHELDVTDPNSVQTFIQAVTKKFGHVDALVNNAGLSKGLDTVSNSKEEDWKQVWETNVMGVVRMSKATIPLLKEHAGCRIINIGSIAGLESYEGGSVYTSSKYALRSVTQTLRYELLEKGIGVTSVDPGLAETEFSIVRFSGDAQKAKKVYEGLSPLMAQDVAEVVGFAMTRPDHVNLDQIVVMPTSQASAKRVNRKL